MAVLSHHVRTVERAHDYLGLSYQKIADTLNADESTLHRWRNGAEPSAVFVARLEALEAFLAELEATFRRPRAAREWLERPIAALKGRRPIEFLESGRIDVLTGVLYTLNAGMTT